MIRRLAYIMLLLGTGNSAFSQLQPLLDQYHLNGLAINPAYAGSQEALNIELFSRIQWVGFEGAPRTNILSVHSPLRNRKVNLGLIILGDKLGSKRETGVLLNYAYRIQLGKGKWSLGLAAGMTNVTTDLNSLRFNDLEDQLLQTPAKSTLMPEFSVGSYYYSKRFYAGISMPLFLSHYANEENGNYQVHLNLKAANYLLTAGYLFTLSDGIEILPSFLLKTNPANSTQLDFQCYVIFKEMMWIGTGIRTNGSLDALLQIQVNPQLKIGYSYRYELSELSAFQHGSHEVVLQYNFRYILKVMSPRYF